MHNATRLAEGWTVSLEPAGGPPGTGGHPSRESGGGDRGGGDPGCGVPDGIRDAGPLPAEVPGCVHTDLLAAGLIDDPYLDDNEARLGWIGRADWSYQTAFDAAGGKRPGARADLVFDGLDTVATITLNGVEIGRTANMHRSHRFDVTGLLRERDNRLRVRFGSAYRYAEALRARTGELPCAYPEPFNFIRKMACNFGWDWGPTLVTAGPWRPVWLHRWETARLARVRPLVTVDGDTGRVELRVDLERAGDKRTGGEAAGAGRAGEEASGGGVAGIGRAGGEASWAADGEVAGAGRVGGAWTGDGSATAGTVTLTAELPELGVRGEVRVPAGRREAVITLTAPGIRRWWPRGYGEQHRHQLRVVLSDGAGRELDRWQRMIGFREVRLDRTADANGTAFTVVVNDVPVFARGVNWIPDDAFPARVTRQRLATRLAQACEANVNFIRVWGGGLYESDDFYDLADELGLLVQQDFLFACAAYPEDEPLRCEVEAEARENVVRLAHHPSLVLWTGNNENIWGYHDWKWQEPLAGRNWGAGYYFDLLPRVVAELDPTRPYWPGSPYSGRPDLHPNAPEHGSTHIWDVWNTHDYTRYREYRPRFVAEFGYQGPPVYATLRRAVSDQPLAPDSPGVRWHQKAEDGDGKLRRGLLAHLPEPADFDDWHYLTQVNQARAVALGVEHFRSLRPYCMGAVVWQLNDCWPVTSWAAVDADGRRKPLWYTLRRVFADRLLTIQPAGDGGLCLVAVNDGGEPWTAQVDVARLALDGGPRAKTVVDLAVPARGRVTVPLPEDVATPEDPRGELLLAQIGDAGSDHPLGGPAGTEPAGTDSAGGTPGGEPGAGTAGETGAGFGGGVSGIEPAGGETGAGMVGGGSSGGALPAYRAWWFFAEDRDMDWPASRYDASVEPVTGGADTLRVTVRAGTALRDLTLFPDRLSPSAVADRALVTLLPGESVTFTVTGAAGVDRAALTGRPVLRCVNDVPAGRG